VRRARSTDIDAVFALERRVWSREGTYALSREHFIAWMEVYPRAFLVAEEKSGAIVGYIYAQAMRFSPEDIPLFKSYDEMTDSAYTRATHEEAGNGLYGISTVSARRGAGMALTKCLLACGRWLGKTHFFGVSRLAGFAGYMDALNSDKHVRERLPAIEEKDIVLWYTIQCVRLTGGKTLPSFPKLPELDLPLPERPDPALSFHLAYDCGAAALKKGYMRDPASRDWGVFVLCDLSAGR